jgi:hypothetical protein
MAVVRAYPAATDISKAPVRQTRELEVDSYGMHFVS